MIKIDEAFVQTAAPNAAAISNGKSLVSTGKFVALNKSEDETLIFGECSGSGSSNYQCSCDFLQESSPVYRCNCPSRQFPCKHCIGLMYALVKGNSFSVAPVPDDVAAKREKSQVRTEKKKADPEKPRTVNKSALAKKIKAQLEGIDLLEQFISDLLRTGMGNTNAKTARQIEEQAKQLGDAYLPGAQSALRSYTQLFVNQEGRLDEQLNSAQRESIYSEALDQLTRLHALVKQGRTYLNARLADPELAPETETPIAAWLGHAWQLRELKDAGLSQANAELIQLAFHTYDDTARKEFVDVGIWMDLSNGMVQMTQTFRPYKAAKMIRSEDSFFKIAVIPELYWYPGAMNRRVRWEESTARDVAPADLKKVRELAKDDFAAVVKEIKNYLKSPLADKQPVVALRYARIGALEDGTLVVEDPKGGRLALTDIGAIDEPPSCHMFQYLPASVQSDQVLTARFHHDIDAGTLRVKPLSIVTKDQVIRLTY